MQKQQKRNLPNPGDVHMVSYLMISWDVTYLHLKYKPTEWRLVGKPHHHKHFYVFKLCRANNKIVCQKLKTRFVRLGFWETTL